MYDVIGDVHGQGGKLRALLEEMGYASKGGAWRAPAGRQAVFVGDLIDRGPEQLEVLDLVRRMVDTGQARLVLGNHEFNALGYSTRHPVSGQHLRPRSDKNRRQHQAFLAAVGEDTPRHREWIDWFRRQPLALDLGGLRVVHAWWDDAAVRAIRHRRGADDGPLDDARLLALYDDPALTDARQRLTCGVEWPLPAGQSIVDKEGHRHGEVRLAVWRHGATSLREMALAIGGLDDAVLDQPVPRELHVAPIEGAPILIGHHWFSGPLRLETPRLACLDWSAARGGPLVAYRWDGEADLQHAHLVAVGGAPLSP